MLILQLWLSVLFEGRTKHCNNLPDISCKQVLLRIKSSNFNSISPADLNFGIYNHCCFFFSFFSGRLSHSSISKWINNCFELILFSTTVINCRGQYFTCWVSWTKVIVKSNGMRSLCFWCWQDATQYLLVVCGMLSWRGLDTFRSQQLSACLCCVVFVCALHYGYEINFKSSRFSCTINKESLRYI